MMASPENPKLRMSPSEFLSLPEYSATLPTGTTPGKRWRAQHGAYAHLRRGEKRNLRWLVGEYGEVSKDGKSIKINWYDPVIVIRAEASRALKAMEG